MTLEQLKSLKQSLLDALKSLMDDTGSEQSWGNTRIQYSLERTIDKVNQRIGELS